MAVFGEHNVDQSCCLNTVSVLRKVNASPRKDSAKSVKPTQTATASAADDKSKAQTPKLKEEFPPTPPNSVLRKKIARGFCEETSPTRLSEAGCAVCGSLTRTEVMESLDALDESCLALLTPSVAGITRRPRTHSTEPVLDLEGPVLNRQCSGVCRGCIDVLRRGKTPTLSLANGTWIGNVPAELQDLSYVEKLLIARVRHNRCIIRVSSSGMNKMVANVIAFQHPSHKIYKSLPPALEELDDVLAVLFTGPCAPTIEDFKRTPLLVRRIKVVRALEWLILNHPDYGNLIIDHDALSRYPEHGPPVSVEYLYSESNKLPEATSVHDNEANDGNEDGPCPFTVHGITG
ncbi:hypothetical protein BJ138DRAFT_1017121, partial [Hygrophoropsis aurantiaca]